MAQLVLADGEIHPERQLAYLKRILPAPVWDRSYEYITGVLHTYDYFVNTTDGRASNRSVQGTRLTWFGVIERAIDTLTSIDVRSNRDEEQRTDLARLVDFVRLKEGQSMGRNPFRELLRKEGHAINDSWWHTVVDAWNAAVEGSLGVDGSFSPLPCGYPVSVLAHVPLDYFSDTGGDERVPTFLRVAEILKWDPLALSWSIIDEVRSVTRDTRQAAQREIAHRNERNHETAVFAHLRELTRAIVALGPRTVTQAQWRILGYFAEMFTPIPFGEYGEYVGEIMESRGRVKIVSGVMRDEWRRSRGPEA